METLYTSANRATGARTEQGSRPATLNMAEDKYPSTRPTAAQMAVGHVGLPIEPRKSRRASTVRRMK